MPILRLIIYQPQAHYRIPFTFQRRHTYPIPPYSTIIGFLCNACGIDDQKKEIDVNQNKIRPYEIIKELKISIAGRFEAKITEMIWFRNLSKEAHVGTYGEINNRKKNGQVGHIGGQAPMKIDVLENVELIIYLYHNEKDKLEFLENLLKDPKERLQVLHIGRAEDWIVYKGISIIDENNFEIKRQDGRYPYFFWTPEKIFSPQNNNTLNWNNFDGLVYNLTTFSSIKNYESHFNHTGQREYKYIRAKLNDGKIINTECLFDKELNIPVFLADFNQSKGVHNG
ncbi:type I-B CRISPR-associated protein Cas5b [Treponema sp. J25]|uniref:type I-B CRISPR-associated protein Cas5b n=1 Tax=Treponema sp. J25 TaxID=2094121 RepID=UPI00104F4213|nr:type I-B CRISPR-associated protein Cas5b [Treponema sp. J25]NPV38762.1 type I-B CRISPR-associated protein Cas5 [Brevinematales bacterium]TCW61807.1 type I-B CRISPR-associated protein Cas5 [Treponema sp. J25]